MSANDDDLQQAMEQIFEFEAGVPADPAPEPGVVGGQPDTAGLFDDPRSWTEHAARIYAVSVKKMLPNGSPAISDLKAQAMGIIQRMRPRDPVEELLVSQMLWTHGRLMFLTNFANRQTQAKWSKLFHDSAERAANLYRRQMQALADYRRPRRARRRNSFTAIRTANISAQQVITQANVDRATRGNHGLPAQNAGEETWPTKAHRAAQDEIETGDQEEKTVAEEHGAPGLSGEEDCQSERDQAWALQPMVPRVEQGVCGIDGEATADELSGTA